MTIPICPRCNKSDETYAIAKCVGSAIEYFDEEGRSDGINTSAVEGTIGQRFTPSKTARCLHCKRIRRDLTVVDGRVVER